MSFEVVCPNCGHTFSNVPSVDEISAKLKDIRENHLGNLNEWESDFFFSIENRVNYTDYSLSDKQMKALEKLFNKLERMTPRGVEKKDKEHMADDNIPF